VSVLFYFYLNIFIEKVFEKSQQRPPKEHVQFGHHVLFNVCSILKPLSFEGRFHLRRAKTQL
jgi:hypothetical protein